MLIDSKYVSGSVGCQAMRVAIDDDGKVAKPVVAGDLNRHIARHLGIYLPVALMQIPNALTEVKNHKIPLGLTLDRRDSPVLTVKLVPRPRK